jgi:spore coat polysaccharide biosynthesis predicted glycosyltransferase SpsG
LKAQKFKVHLIAPLFRDNSDVIALVSLAKKINSNWIVVDGCHFSSEYEKSIKQKVPNVKLMRVEDVPSRHHFADVLLSPNFDSENMIFSTESSTIQLLGLKYLVLRREFYDAERYPESVPHFNLQKILVTLGGGTHLSDAANLTIAQALKDVEADDLDITFVAGKMSQNIKKTRRLLKSRHRLFAHCDNMAELINKADIAIVSGGSTMWELMYMGTPFLTIALTKIQDDYLKKMHDKKLCIHLGFFSDLDPMVAKQSVLNFLNDATLRAEFKKRYSEIFGVQNYSKELLDVLLS